MKIFQNENIVSLFLKPILIIGICVLNFNCLLSQTSYHKEFDSLIIHHVLHSGDTIIEGRTDSGLSKWYGYKVEENVCLEDVCNPVEIWIFWDCIGRYEKFEILRGKPLTKIHHEVFTDSDYDFLDRILKQEAYLFRDLEYDDLITYQEKPENLDAFTGATSKNLSQYVVEGAAYTCFILWKKVHGYLKTKVKELAIQNTEESYLNLLLESDNPKHGELAILIMSTSSVLQKDYQNDLINLMKSDDEDIYLYALNSIKHQFGDLKFQKKISEEFVNFSPRMRQEIVWQFFRQENVDQQVILMLIDEFNAGRMEPHELSLVIKMIASQSLIDDKNIHDALIRLSSDENSFVRRITSNLLLK